MMQANPSQLRRLRNDPSQLSRLRLGRESEMGGRRRRLRDEPSQRAHTAAADACIRLPHHAAPLLRHVLIQGVRVGIRMHIDICICMYVCKYTLH